MQMQREGGGGQQDLIEYGYEDGGAYGEEDGEDLAGGAQHQHNRSFWEINNF